MKIFITGGSGFIGKPLVKKLCPNNQVLLLSSSLKGNPFNDNVKIINGKLENIEEWKTKVSEFNPDVTIHLAWEGIPDHGCQKSLKNAINSVRLFEFLKEINCKKVICSGSCFEYGVKQGKLDEKNPIKPTDPFTAAKTFIQRSGMDIFNDSDSKFIWARFFYVYGPNQRSGSLIPTIYDSIQKKEIPDIRKPDAKNDFVFIEDVAEAIGYLISSDIDSGIYNIGTGESVSIRRIMEIVSENLNRKLSIESKGGENVDFHADISKIRKLGWSPKTGIEEGIRKYIESRR